MKTFALGFCGALAAFLLMALMGFQEAVIAVDALPKIFFNGQQVPINERIELRTVDGLYLSCGEAIGQPREVKSTVCWLNYNPSSDDARRIQERAKEYNTTTGAVAPVK
jgi:hypothetical protein